MGDTALRMENALFNWLQIHVVSKARPDDQAAQNTADFFYSMLVEDHRLQDVEVEADDTMYSVRYKLEGEAQSKRYPREVVDQLLRDIEAEPRYNE